MKEVGDYESEGKDDRRFSNIDVSSLEQSKITVVDENAPRSNVYLI